MAVSALVTVVSHQRPLAAVSPAAAQQPVFRAETDLVTVGVTVSVRGARVQPPLAREDFEVREDGAAQAVSYFAAGDDLETAPPLHLGLLFDTSGSMGDDIQLARSAAIKFLNTLTEAVDITLVDFDTEVRAARFTQQDFPRLVERIRSRKPQGFTAMYDALGVYLDGAAEEDGRTILVVFSDGGDTRSALRFTEALTLLRASDVTVFSIGFLEHQPSSARLDQRTRLTQIAEESGGEAFFPRRCARWRKPTPPSKPRSAASTRWAMSPPTLPATAAGARSRCACAATACAAPRCARAAATSPRI